MPKGRPVPPANSVLDVRLFDRVRAKYGLPDMPVIVADEIARQIDALPGDNFSSTPPAESYGIVAPPFKQCFIEAASTHQAFVDKDSQGRPLRVPAGIAFRGVAVYDVGGGGYEEQMISAAHRARMPPNTYWTLALFGYMYVRSAERGSQLRTFPAPLFVHLDPSGRVLDNTEKFYIEVFQSGGITLVLSPPGVQEGIDLNPQLMPAAELANFVPFALRAINAMHRRCIVEEVTPSRQARRHAEHQEKIPELHNFYVLKVKPTPTNRPATIADVAQPETSGERRSHRVRGHFRYYGPDAPLFGRVTGMVWVPDHQRGNDQLGTISKEYEPQP